MRSSGISSRAAFLALRLSLMDWKPDKSRRHDSGWGLALAHKVKNVLWSLTMVRFQQADRSHPVPQIDAERCDGCGLCVKICPERALAIESGLAVVARPLQCEYQGLCEMACPLHAIQRPLEIVSASRGPDGSDGCREDPLGGTRS